MVSASGTLVKTPHFDVADLGEFTLLLHDETLESGAPLAKQINERISQAFAKLDPVLALIYELEITEIDAEKGSRKSRNRVRLVKKKPKDYLEKIGRVITGACLVLGVLSTDYSKIPDNVHKAINTVVTEYRHHGKNIDVTEIHLHENGPAHPPDDSKSQKANRHD